MKLGTIILLFCSLSINIFALADNIDDLKFNIVAIINENNLKYYVISMMSDSDFNLDSLVNSNYNKLQYRGTEIITMSCDSLSSKPISCIFEDNIGGIIPYYKFIVGFENIGECERKTLKIKINGKDYIIE